MTPAKYDSLPRRQFIKKVGLTAASAAILSKSWVALGEEDPDPVSIAVVGGAHIHAPDYVRILHKRDTVKVKYCWDHDKARAEKHGKTLEAKVVDDLKAIWDDPEIKAVVICSETNRHRDLVLAAAAAKKHMFVEKPLGVTGAEAMEMADAIQKANLLFTTGYFMRTTAPVLFLKQQVASGSFGKITRVRGSNCHDGSMQGWFDKDYLWMTDLKQSGVGGFGDLGTHALDILLWLFGDVELVTADIKLVTGKYKDCDESGEALLKFKNGITGTLAAGWVDLANPETFSISGTEGHAAIINGSVFFTCPKVEGADGKQPWTKLPAPLVAPIDQFIEAICGKKDAALVTAKEAALRVCVMEAAYKAAKARTWVSPA